MTEIARPLRFDFGAGETFPFAGVAFHQVGFNNDRPNTDLGTDDLRRLECTNKG